MVAAVQSSLTRSRSSQRRTDQGFTLTELLFVVLVLGIVAAIAIPSLGKMQSRAKEGSVVANAHALQMQIETFLIANYVPPENSAMLNDPLAINLNLAENPFTMGPTLIGNTGEFSAGNLGYSLDTNSGFYRIEGYGANASRGPAGDGIVIVLESF